jgi:hypothetical protein
MPGWLQHLHRLRIDEVATDETCRSRLHSSRLPHAAAGVAYVGITSHDHRRTLERPLSVARAREPMSTDGYHARQRIRWIWAHIEHSSVAVYRPDSSATGGAVMTEAEQNRIAGYVGRVARLWRLDLRTREIVFDPTGSWWFRWSHRLFLRPRTELRHLYFWQMQWAATSVGMAFPVPIEHDNTFGMRAAPRKMWMNQDWTIRRSATRHIKSVEPRPHIALLLSSDKADASVLVRPWTVRERALLTLAVFLGAVSFVGSIASIWSAWIAP